MSLNINKCDHTVPVFIGCALQKLTAVLSILALLMWLSACDSVPAEKESEWYPGGDTSVSTYPFVSLMLPARNLPKEDSPDFHAGKALANQPWVKAPTVTTARDGLGPVYNARTCLACHINGGRGRLPETAQEGLFNGFVRISIPAVSKADKATVLIHGAVPEPIYGIQLQTQSTALSHQFRHHLQATKTKLESREAPPEAYIYLQWLTQDFTYPDGSLVKLRRPKLDITNPAYGALHPDTQFSLRNAPFMHGLGLLELIEQKDIDALSDPQDQDKNGISGRSNQVWDFKQKKTVPGRFGLKANRANDISIVAAAAFAEDVGISNPIFPVQPCTDKQPRCLKTPDGNDANGHEIAAVPLELVADFTRNIGVPLRDKRLDTKALRAGRKWFYTLGCQQCHHPSYKTMPSNRLPHLGNQIIWPYTDLLLHDMGEALSDHRSDYLASGSEWRTPPLWSIGLTEKVNGSKNLLHDGRARNVEEAILWHGGEAEAIKQKFVQLEKTQREKLIRFVESL